jgi:hypothetical protein
MLNGRHGETILKTETKCSNSNYCSSFMPILSGMLAWEMPDSKLCALASPHSPKLNRAFTCVSWILFVSRQLIHLCLLMTTISNTRRADWCCRWTWGCSCFICSAWSHSMHTNLPYTCHINETAWALPQPSSSLSASIHAVICTRTLWHAQDRIPSLPLHSVLHLSRSLPSNTRHRH